MTVYSLTKLNHAENKDSIMTTTPGTEIVELDTGVFARLHAGLTNAGIIIGDNSVLVIDSLRVPSFARDLIQDVRHITDKPIQYVIDTHSHWDHAWGNEEFPDATIIAHANARKEMLDVEWNRQWLEKVVSAGDPWSEEAKIVKITPPDLTFENTMQLYFGGREINLVYLGKAHTSGDIFIHLPKEKLLFTGDVAQDSGIPFLGDSYPADWLSTDDRLIEIEADRFMSGHGPVGDHSALVDARDFIHELVGNVMTSIAENEPEASASNTVVTKMQYRFGDWRGFESLADKIPEVYQKLNT
jgi:cyclase